MHQLKERLTYSNVMATVAVFVALGGTSYAAITLPRNSVGSNQIRSSAVRSAEVRDRSLSLRDLTARTRTALRGERGPRGEKGEQGPAGIVTDITGRQVNTTLSVIYKTATGSVAAGEATAATAQCDANQRVLGGGVRVDTGTDLAVRESYPNVNNTAWTGRVGNDDTSGVGSYTVTAVCTPAS